ncbi:glycosyltransferase [Bacteroides cellulosilyticus]|uniref:Glycosyltransferase n=3 Tax=Bacteroides cellulosilyticus TaxID=246787 RepID=A0A412HZ61_9BACE|nr:glycosyltransferase [Bacteroides cellulosilyticus]
MFIKYFIQKDIWLNIIFSLNESWCIIMNILLLSTIYPLPSKGNRGTSVCHYFAKEWVKEGHNVRVVHYQAVYPFFFYWAARVAQNLIATKTGAVVYTKRDRGAQYEWDGVQVLRIPLFKLIPHGKFLSIAINKSIKEIIKNNAENSFIPDIVVGHFPNPQIAVVARLKRVYSSATTAIVIHGDLDQLKSIYGEGFKDFYRKIDLWGFRSKKVREDFEKKYGKLRHSFICYSGVPANYITESNTHSFKNPLNKFIYVGEMIKRKYPAEIIEALVNVYEDKNFRIDYVGNGRELETIKLKMEKYLLQKQVVICGRIPRDEIKAKYDNADCMIMISRGEAYGLVYLEAMARGCITIASRGEGFDGVIEDGVNGFLCEAGNTQELANIIRKINALTSEERLAISEKAIETSRRLTDKNAADLYLNNLIIK